MERGKQPIGDGTNAQTYRYYIGTATEKQREGLKEAVSKQERERGATERRSLPCFSHNIHIKCLHIQPPKEP